MEIEATMEEANMEEANMEKTEKKDARDARSSEQPRTEIVGIAGSLREGSFNRALIRAARDAAPDTVRFRIYDGLADVPAYDADEDGDPPPPAVAELRGTVRRADGVLFATPEYNHSVPGVLKNAVDWASRPYGDSSLAGKPAAVVGASTSRFGARWAQEDLRRVLEACDAEVLEDEVAVSRASERFEDGRLVDPEVREELEGVLRRLAGRAGACASRRAACGRR